MKLLIDTQVFAWLVSGNPKLGSQTRIMLGNSANRVFISYFSFLEMAIKKSIGKWDINLSIIEDLPSMDIELIMPDVLALNNYAILNPDNKDPIDNILMSVARNEKYTLVTSDEKILKTTVPNLTLQNAKL
jgi:PIN domain nuclease of toxin-antitoxin system